MVKVNFSVNVHLWMNFSFKQHFWMKRLNTWFNDSLIIQLLTATYWHKVQLQNDSLINPYHRLTVHLKRRRRRRANQPNLEPLRGKNATSIPTKPSKKNLDLNQWLLRSSRKNKLFCHLASAVENAQSLRQYLWLQTKVYQLLYWQCCHEL